MRERAGRAGEEMAEVRMAERTSERIPERVAAPEADLDETELRACLAHFASGVTVVTYDAPQGPRGITVNAFTSVSLRPPLVLVSVARSSRSHDILAGRPFTVNILRPEQEAIARHFASGGDDHSHMPWCRGGVGPRLSGVLAYLECEPWRAYEGGDHTLYLGRVVALGYQEGDALGFFCSRFVPVPRPIPSQPPLPYDPFELPYDAP
jgi:flavin reductase (DIM6/NTAB) family NADH-FMN oxidoreductase RutF